MATQAKQVEAPKAPDTMRIWNAVSKTDPAHTKGFKRGGGFSGTAIKPMWVWQRLTDLFGPCGTGWGMDKPEYQVVNGDNREVLVFCTVAGWYVDNGERKVVFGEGGDKVVTYIKANDQYKRPERWENDDEAFKKAFTDALMNAFKFIGVGADVHMGMFDDSKYVNDLRKEFAEPANDQPSADNAKPQTITEEQRKEIMALAVPKGIDARAICERAGVASIKEMPADVFDAAKAWVIRQKPRAAAQEPASHASDVLEDEIPY